MNNIFILLELWQLLDNVFSELRTIVLVVNVWVPYHFFKLGKHSKKKIAEKETLVHSHLPPSLPSLNGTRGMGT